MTAIGEQTQPMRSELAERRFEHHPARRIADHVEEGTNVGYAESWISLLGGSALALYGLQQRTLGGMGLALLGGTLVYRGATRHCPIYEAAGLSTARVPDGGLERIPARHGVKVEESITILRPAEELFSFWRHFENLPRFMGHLESVQILDDRRSHWVAKGPLGSRVEWDAEIITERPNEMIGWQSVSGSQVATAGSVHFTKAPGDRGTEVRVVLKYDPPGGRIGATAAWLTGRSPEQEIREDLRSFKRIMEIGSLPTIEGQPRGTCS